MATHQSPTAPKNLIITAISAENGSSTIECWEMSSPFQISNEAGVTGAAFAQLGPAKEISYAVIPPKYNGGLHHAPRVQWVAFLSGEAIISIPNSDQRAHIQGGKHGLIFVADTTDVSIEGHLTMYPGDVETTALQIPTADGQIPAHVVLCKGVCGGHDDRG